MINNNTAITFTMRVADDVSGLIGNTPLVLLKNPDGVDETVKIYGKVECLNPGNSVKDRTAIGMIIDAEQRGLLRPKYTIVESTSGNLGHALAMIAAARGYKFIAVVDPKMPAANINLYKALGAEIEIVSEKDELGSYQKYRIARAKTIAATRNNCVNLDQYSNPSAQNIHYVSTGPEIFEQLKGKVDVLVANASTGSHLCGTARFLKERTPGITVIGVEPEGSVVFGGVPGAYLQNGTGLSFVPKNYDPSVVDVKLKVSDIDAFSTVRKVARETGLLFGGSSGAALYAAFEHAKKCTSPQNIVAILPDSGLKYMDTIYDDEWIEKHVKPLSPEKKADLGKLNTKSAAICK